MEYEAAFANYIETSLKVKNEIIDIANGNTYTYFANLDDIEEINSQLHKEIQKGFAKKYKNFQEILAAFSVKLTGKELDLSFYNPVINLKIRDIRSGVLGDLVSFAGMVTRSSQVRPELVTGAFICKDCNAKIANVNQDFKFTEPLQCSNPLCQNRTRYELCLESCTFSNWQRIHVQEATSEIPNGCLPRSIDVIIRNELIERIKPGTNVKLTGFAAAVPAELGGMISSRSAPVLEGVANEKSRRRNKDLSYKIVFFCIQAEQIQKMEGGRITLAGISLENKESAGTEFTIEETEIIRRMQSSHSLYESLSSSLFPNIYGHENIKSAILLMLVGGVMKKNDIRQRGDINILLLGDPGTAKSQFLKQTASLSPSSVYTSGKSSSAAGLTAAVVRDGETGEFTIEAGALMLSDGGVCCIDEFDKMNYKDQVSIHEAMEQQTITIAKGGINATLNSRSSILAAANPIRGRYDKKKTLRQNVNLSAPIMSRFDLYFILIDDIDATKDRRVARKILENHALPVENDFRVHPFTPEEVMLYVRFVKNKMPVLTDEAREMLAEKYVGLRQDSLTTANNYRMTVRHLESLLRLSEALAKIHNDDRIGVEYVQEASRLIKSSMVEIQGEDIKMCVKKGEDPYVVKGKDYLKMTNILVYLIKTESYTKEGLCLKYLEYVEDTLISTEMLEAEKEKCQRVIAFLMESEGVIFENDGVIEIHPDYAG